MPSINDINPLTNFRLPSIGTVGSILLLITLAGIVVILVAVIAFILITKKTFWIKIHVFRLIGNTPTRVAIFKAKEENVGRAGDKLWRVAPSGLGMPFKIIKWLPVGKYQTASAEFWYWIRQDGEWINFTLSDLDKQSEKLNIKFIQEDMRLQRLATERLLTERFLKKSFWERYGPLIMYLIFFLVITVAMVIIFFQWSKIVEQISNLVSIIENVLETQQTASTGLIPAS